jgi:hypothetical protein
MTKTATLAKLKARLALYETALESALTAQSYSVAGRSKQMANVKDIESAINGLEARIARLEQSENSSSVYTPVFIPRNNLSAGDDDE